MFNIEFHTWLLGTQILYYSIIIILALKYFRIFKIFLKKEEEREQIHIILNLSIEVHLSKPFILKKWNEMKW